MVARKMKKEKRDPKIWISDIKNELWLDWRSERGWLLKDRGTAARARGGPTGFSPEVQGRILWGPPCAANDSGVRQRLK